MRALDFLKKARPVSIAGLPDKELVKLSRENVLSLSLEEMKAVQEYFKKKGRNPTDVELETVAQTWSEHCKHKTLTGIVEYQYKDENGKWKTRTFNNLLKETVFRVTMELDKKWCISVFSDNAGIIEFDEKFGVAFKVETHNHPSALEPYGGAATGIGGVIRDVLGVGLGAKPIANTDVFCFGVPDIAWDSLPAGVLHPRRIAKGVVAGVRDYGNRMGIPTVNGAVYFDEGYISNPLVYCGTLGIIPKDKCAKKVSPGDLVLVVGGRTGRDGIHGATFSSIQLEQDTDVSAVQIGNPIVEKKVMDTVLKARDLNLYSAITDCGAGGLSSAVGELGEECGVRVHLERVPLKYAGLKPWEIWVSEAQERMVLSVPPAKRNEIEKIFASENVEAVFIGEFTGDNKLTVMHGDEVVADLDMKFLHKGVPRPTRRAIWNPVQNPKAKIEQKQVNASSYGDSLKKLLSSYNIASKEWIVRQYDHEVQGQTVIKPMHGPSFTAQGPGDAAVIWPYTVTGGENSGSHASRKAGASAWRGVVLSCGLNPEYGKIDPYWMAASAIDEALRNAVCVGGSVERMAILDNFCWGNPNRPEQLGGLVRASLACYDMAKVFQTPFISGKDSLHNEYALGDKVLSIPPALLISAVGIVEDIRKTVTMDIKENGNLIYILGATAKEMGGSHYNKISKITGGSVPKVDPAASRARMIALSAAMEAGLVRSCHDCSEGGISVAIAEMCFAGDKGVTCDIAAIPADGALTDSELLFSESNGRFIIEVQPSKKSEFEKLFKGLPISAAGNVTEAKMLVFRNAGGHKVINEKIGELRDAWNGRKSKHD
ncbi:MAG: phosphoribosylformylglycinamidine synthase II [Elusimicrobia bacterium RIFOXYA2_FULL_50_26]|nr:MAG: phosphoribosylformylglycinamidine synthase II [Elusimicrobia bacterium RIFOXYA2_FULL_50_26]OGS25286.1 MAG: phosphoribosylformylglycinamidine synthase II [Elusimicrobia bacterium RIFOXYB2_FULL_50_12]